LLDFLEEALADGGFGAHMDSSGEEAAALFADA